MRAYRLDYSPVIVLSEDVNRNLCRKVDVHHVCRASGRRVFLGDICKFRDRHPDWHLSPYLSFALELDLPPTPRLADMKAAIARGIGMRSKLDGEEFDPLRNRG